MTHSRNVRKKEIKRWMNARRETAAAMLEKYGEPLSLLAKLRASYLLNPNQLEEVEDIPQTGDSTVETSAPPSDLI